MASEPVRIERDLTNALTLLKQHIAIK